MKKLMIAAAAAALVGGVFAADAFNYKASVKYVDLNSKGVKVVKTASLTGYLVTEPDCPCTVCDVSEGDKPYAFLVVQNKKAKSGAKIFPANLLIDAWATKDITNAKKATLQAQGYLFAGNNAKAQFPMNDWVYNFGDATTKGTMELFGDYNTTQGGKKDGAFVDSWLYAAGFGKAALGSEKKPCFSGYDGYACLTSLSGSVIGGLYLCDGNAYWEDFLCLAWNLEGTTDVISGTWSIKATTLAPGAADVDATVVSQDLLDLVDGAAKKIDGKNFSLAAWDKVPAYTGVWF